MVYSLNEIKSATGDFLASNIIGFGAFGEVYRGYLRHTKVAIKCVKDTVRHRIVIRDHDSYDPNNNQESEGTRAVDMEEVTYLSKYKVLAIMMA